MKSPVAIISFFVIVAVACTTTPSQNNQPEIPEALQETTEVTEVMSKGRSYENIVDALYIDALKKNPALHAFQKDISAFNKEQIDSLTGIGHFVEKNNAYYATATAHIRDINDSSLRKMMYSIMEKSRTTYDRRIASADSLLKGLHEKDSVLQDMHKVLKLVTTLPLIEQYQKSSMPPVTPVQGLIKKSTHLISTIDSIVQPLKK